MSDIKLKKIERIFCVVTGLIAILLIILAIFNYLFIPAACIMTALNLFGIYYIYQNDNSKKLLKYSLFIIGVGLIFFAVIYTIIKTR